MALFFSLAFVIDASQSAPSRGQKSAYCKYWIVKFVLVTQTTPQKTWGGRDLPEWKGHDPDFYERTGFVIHSFKNRVTVCHPLHSNATFEAISISNQLQYSTFPQIDSGHT